MASSSSRARLWRYDVFLSFRGPDTRQNIVSHINSALLHNGIFTFKDDERLEIGNSIPDELVRAIQTSRFAIVFISENYATSTWCLEELRMIMELQAVKDGIIVVPIFHGVAPCDVRHQRGSFGTAFASIVSSETAEKILRWREALTRVANLSGFDSNKCVDEATMVVEVVQRLLDGLFPAHTIDEDVVGMSRHMEGLASLLEMESEKEVRFVGIWGMGGVGKTTIAKYLYSRFSRQFQDRCFISDVKKDYKERKLPYLRKKFLSEILGDERLRLGSMGAGSDEIKSRLEHQNVFAVLDDVDQVEQLDGLAKDTTWFGPGSRIIIITRDKGLLDTHGVTNVYPVKCLDQDNALQMFKHIAFGGGPCPNGFEQLTIRASRLAHGLPYALHSYSSQLHNITSAEEWEKALLKYEKSPDSNIFRFLRSSYEALTPRDKIAFLHVACLFNGHHSLRASSLLDDGESRIENLVQKSLVDISAQGCINMHGLVEEMGRELVVEESGYIIQKQRILWGNDVYDVLLDNTGTKRIEGLALDTCEIRDVLHIVHSNYNSIPNMKYLNFYTHSDDKRSKVELIPREASLPRKLRLLRWDAYPLTSLPSFPRDLIELTLRRSNLQTLCISDLLRKLKRLDVSGSKDLTQLPDLSMATELEELVAEGCMKLRLISLTSTTRRYSLRNLDISNCVSLPSIPPFIPEWISLAEQPIFFRCQGTRLKFEITALGPFENLCIDGDIQIRLQQLVGDAECLSYISKQQTTFELRLMRPSNWPDSHISGKTLHIKRSYYNNNGGAPFSCISFSGFSCLAELKLINLNIDKLPDDIDLLHSLEKLDLTGNDFTHLPTTLGSLELLKILVLCNCSKLEELPSLPRQLQKLKLSGCTNLQSLLAAAHEESSQLLELHLDDCKNLESLTHGLGQFTKLMLLDLCGHEFQTIPTCIKNLLTLITLCLNNCNKLKSLEELPLSLNYLNAHGCSSLETVSLPLNHSIKHLDLSHCSQLHQGEELITQFLKGWKHEQVLLRFACIPGTVIPSYFDNQSLGTSIQLSFNGMGFTACIMIACSRPYHLQFLESSYCWSWEAGGVFRINLRPNIYRSYGMDEEEAVTEHYLVIIRVLSSKNNDQVANLLFSSALELTEVSEIPLVEIKACGVRIDIPNQI